jgi:hypothetical protein
VNVPNALSTLGLAALVIPLAGGCYSAQVDPDLGGAFVCGGAEQAECPGSLVCVNERCEDADLVPALMVLDPEDEQSFTRDDILDMVMPGAGIDLEIRIQGSIELISASAGADHAFGEGHVKVLVDGMEQATVDSGSIDSSTPVMVRVPAVAGPHRILLQAHRNDGVAYDNPEATAMRLFWFESAAMRRPFVAIKSPVPGAAFDLDDQTIDVELATLHFTLVEPGGARQAEHGHAHVYYDTRVEFPECVRDPGCDSSYLAVVGASGSTELGLPESDAGSDILSIVARNVDHSPYGQPFDCDPTVPGPLDLCSPVFDSIEIVRVEE